MALINLGCNVDCDLGCGLYPNCGMDCGAFLPSCNLVNLLAVCFNINYENFKKRMNLNYVFRLNKKILILLLN